MDHPNRRPTHASRRTRALGVKRKDLAVSGRGPTSWYHLNCPVVWPSRWRSTRRKPLCRAPLKPAGCIRPTPSEARFPVTGEHRPGLPRPHPAHVGRFSRQLRSELRWQRRRAALQPPDRLSGHRFPPATPLRHRHCRAMPVLPHGRVTAILPYPARWLVGSHVTPRAGLCQPPTVLLTG